MELIQPLHFPEREAEPELNDSPETPQLNPEEMPGLQPRSITFGVIMDLFGPSFTHLSNGNIFNFPASF